MIKAIKYTVFGVLFNALSSFAIYAQKNITHQQSIWYTYQNTILVNEKINLTSEIIERRFMNPNAQHQFAIRERVHYAFNPNVDLVIGFAYFLHSPNNPASKSKLVIPELRPFTEFNLKQNFKKYNLTHRIRAEQRYFRNTLDDNLIPGFTSNWRFRYQFGIETTLFTLKNNQTIGIKFGDEIFINAGKNIVYNTFDQNRLYFTLTYSPNKSLTFGIGYINWFQQRNTGIDYYERDIIRLSIIQKIQFKPKKKV